MKIGDKVLIACSHVPGRPDILIPSGTIAIVTCIGNPSSWAPNGSAKLLYDGHKPKPSDLPLYEDGFWFGIDQDFIPYHTSLPEPDFSLQEIEEASDAIASYQNQ